MPNTHIHMYNRTHCCARMERLPSMYSSQLKRNPIRVVRWVCVCVLDMANERNDQAQLSDGE